MLLNSIYFFNLWRIDYLSTFFIILLLFLFPINYIISYFECKSNYYSLFMLLLYVIIFLCFISISILIFFSLFEFIIIIIFLLFLTIINTFYKIRSSFWFFIYSLIGSLMSLNGIILIIYEFNILLFFIFIIFLIKIPSFPFNFWLIEIHAEASTSLSLILAALILKLGIFGILKYCYISLSFILIILSLFMIVFILLSTLILTFYYFMLFDFKKIIALSSILHLNLSLISLFTLSSISYLTLIINSISHGINAFYAFLLFGFMINKNYSRFIDSLFFITFINRILIFIFILFNISFPLSFNFIVELLSLIILVNISLFLSFIFIIISFISTLYYFLLFNRKITFNFNFIQFNIIELIYNLLFISVIFYYGIYFLFCF